MANPFEGRSGRNGLAGGGQREREPERRSLAGRALDADLSAVPLHDGATDVQPQAQADVRTAVGFDAADTVEAVPDVRALLVGQAGSLVAHPHACHPTLDPDTDLNRAVGRRVLDGVAHV